MLKIRTDIVCVRNTEKNYTFPLTVGKTYKEAAVVWTKNIKEDGIVVLKDDSEVLTLYETDFFDIDTPNTITEEFCPFCGNYPKLPAVVGKFKCPECREDIVTCSMPLENA